LYIPQDKLPNSQLYCDESCQRQAWLVARVRRLMTDIKALEIAIRRLRKSRMPSVHAAASVLGDLRQELIDNRENEHATRVAAFLSKLPRVA
jgi:hypothetical protein